MTRTIEWDKKQPMVIGFTEGYIELRIQKGRVTVEAGVNKLHNTTYYFTVTSNAIREPKIVAELQPKHYQP